MGQILNFEHYTVAWIAVLPIEAEAALAMLDNRHDGQFETARGDDYIYIGGNINGHNVVIATLPEGQNYGIGAAAALVNQVKARFSNIWFALLVGVAAGLPNLSSKLPAKYRDIRLGDVLVCVPEKESVGIVHYDLGKDTEDGFFPNGRQAETPAIVRSAIGNIKLTKKKPFKSGNDFARYLTALQEEDEDGKFLCPSQPDDQLFNYVIDGNKILAKLVDRDPRDELERTKVWYGNIGSGNSLMRNPQRRDELRDKHDLIGLEMEAAGVMNTLPTGVIRGVCDYGDAQKNKDWQPYAAAVAAVYAKGILYTINPKVSQAQEGAPIIRSTLPRPSTPHFTGREECLEDIELKFQASSPGNQRVVLWGLEGIGKSQIALKYAEMCSSKYSTFWTGARTPQEFISGLESIIHALRPNQDSRNINLSLLEEIHELLRDEKSGNWLLVLDGADDKDIFLAQKNGLPPLGNFIPNSPRGRVLITTTDSRIVGLDEGYLAPAQNGIKILPLSTIEGMRFLQNSIPLDFHQELGLGDESLQERLVNLLDCLPIALSHATSQIREDSIHLVDFIDAFIAIRNSPVNQNVGLDQQPGLVTFELSYQRLSGIGESLEKLPQARLLDLMACFDGREIPRKNLQEFYQTELSVVKPFASAMARLRNLSLVEYTPASEAYWILPIVQNWTYQRLSKEDKMYYERLANRALTAAASKTPSRFVGGFQKHQIRMGQPSNIQLGRHHTYPSAKEAPFRILRRLGVGGFGRVFEVEQKAGPNVGKVYASKQFDLRDPHMAETARHEVEILKLIKHRHVIEYVSTFSTPTRFTIVLHPAAEYDLQFFIHELALGMMENQTAEAFSMMCKWLGCLGEAVDFIHTRDIIIGDVKPSNIVIKNTDVILIDFGISVFAKTIPDDQNDSYTPQFAAPERSDSILSDYSVSLGDTQGYTYFPFVTTIMLMEPPEAISRRMVDNKVDIFSLGCVFLEVLTVLLRESIDDFAAYRQGKKGKITSISYSANMGRVLRWIWYLFTKHGTPVDASHFSVKCQGTSSRQQCSVCLVEHAVQWCFLMLQPLPKNRCSAELLVQMMSVSRLPVFCQQCVRRLAPHERSLPPIQIKKAATPFEALEEDFELTWEMANEWWAPSLEMESGSLRI